MISKQDIIDFQTQWGDGIINIGRSYKEGNDYINETKSFINSLYAFGQDIVLFKPTLASVCQFRLDENSALSYFVGGNNDYSEDTGFAIKGWKKIRWDNAGINILNDCAICMGNYFFSQDNEDDLKVEYSMVIKKIDGKLKIILHDSHLPFQK